MDNGSQAAETITRVVIMGTTFVLGLTGKAALTVARFAAAAMDDKAKQSGKIRLRTLLQSGSELKVFTLQGQDNYQKFAEEAKNYGILYSVVKRTDEDVQGEVYDLLVRAEDAGKINRVIEKYHLIEVDGGAVHVDPQKVEESQVVDARSLLSKMLDRGDQAVNPQEASEESTSDASYRMPNQANRPSVVEELNEYVREAEDAKRSQTMGRTKGKTDMENKPKKEQQAPQQDSEKDSQQNVQIIPNIMPNLMGDELAEEEKHKQAEAAELLGDMLSKGKEREM